MCSHRDSGCARPAGIIGHVEVDFVASKEEDRLRLWAVDLNPRPTASLSGFQLFDFLAAGQFDPVLGTYWVPGMPQLSDSDSASLPDHNVTQLDLERAAVLSPCPAPEDPLADGRQPHALPCADAAAAAASASGDSRHCLEDETCQHERGQPCRTAELGQCSGRPSSPAGVGHHAEGVSPVGVSCKMPSLSFSVDQASVRPASSGSEYEYSHGREEAVQAAAERSSGIDATGQHQSDGQLVEGSGAGWQQPESGMLQQGVQLQPRFCVTIDLLIHGGMQKQRSAQFLQKCRLAGLGFDMMARRGLVLNFVDSMASCCLGVQCAGPTPQEALQGLSQVCPLS